MPRRLFTRQLNIELNRRYLDADISRKAAGVQSNFKEGKRVNDVARECSYRMAQSSLRIRFYLGGWAG